MKWFAAAVLGILVGFLAGGISPNLRLAETQDTISNLEEKLAASGRRNRNPVQEVNSLLAISAEELAEAPESEGEAPVDVEAASEASTAEVAQAETENPTNQVDSGSISNQLDLAVKAWAVRVDLAMNQFTEQVDLTETEETRFHVLVEAMNIRLEEQIRGWVDRMKEAHLDAQNAEELGVRLMHDLTETLVLTYDEMDRNLPDGWREAAGEDFELTSLIDPEVARPMTEVEDRFPFE